MVQVPLQNHHSHNDASLYPRPDYSVNDQYPNVKTVWENKTTAISEPDQHPWNIAVYANTNGQIVALDPNSEKPYGIIKTGGKYIQRQQLPASV
jgi:hypothetical protein